MNRSGELMEAIKEYWDERTRTKRDFFLSNYMELEPEFDNRLKFLVDCHSEKVKDGCQKKIKYIYLCHLMSSSCTESYQATLGMSSSMLYLDENKSETYWFPEAIYKNIDQDMDKIKAHLRKKFIRLEEYELFSLKQKLLSDDWKILKECFLLLIKNSIDLVLGSSLPLDDEFEVLAGEYMDKMETLWYMPEEKHGEEWR